jgi:hypothetical protein
MNKSKRNALMKHRKKAKKLKERQKAIALAQGLPPAPKQAPRPKTEVFKPVAAEVKAKPPKKEKAPEKTEKKVKAEKAAAPAEKKTTRKKTEAGKAEKAAAPAEKKTTRKKKEE